MTLLLSGTKCSFDELNKIDTKILKEKLKLLKKELELKERELELIKKKGLSKKQELVILGKLREDRIY